jgi:hypothetical protein
MFVNRKKYHFIRKTVFLYLLCASSLLVSSCAYTTSVPRTDFDDYYESGDFKQAADFNVAKWGKGKEMPYLPALDTGTAFMAAKEHTSADDYFGLAQNAVKYEKTDGYDPKYYEKIMLNTVNGLNLWQNHDFVNARVEFNRAYSAQQSAVRENKRAIAEADEEVKKQNAAKSLSALNKQASSLYDGFGDLSAYKNFANPYASYLAGLYLVLNGRSQSDIENGINYLKRVQAMTPNNSFVRKDLQMAENVAKGKEIPRRVWVVYEEGMAPHLVKETFAVPIYFGAGFKWASIALPKIVPSDSANRDLTAQISYKGTKTAFRAEKIASIDDIMAAEYQDRMPAEVAKAVIWMTVNLAAQEGLQRVGKKDSAAHALGVVASILVSQITNPVEIRTWKTLPKNVSISSFDMPQGAKLSLSVEGKNIADKIVFKQNTKYAIVYVRMPTKGAKPAVIVSEFNGKES